MAEPSQQMNVMALAAPAMRALAVRLGRDFNEALLLFLRRLKQWFPQCAIDIQAAINALGGIMESDELFLTALEQWDSATAPHIEQIQKQDDQFIVERAATLLHLSNLADQWSVTPADIRRRVWGHILKLCNLARNFTTMEHNKERIFQEAFAGASSLVADFEARTGRAATIDDLGQLVPGLPSAPSAPSPPQQQH